MILGGVMVVGSASVDLVVRASHFPQAGETVLGREFTALPGGRGANQAAAVGKLGGRVRLVSKIGGDPFGQEIVRTLGAAGVDTGLVVMDPTLATGVSFVTVDEWGESAVVLAAGANLHLHPDEVRDALLETSPMVLVTHGEIPRESAVAAISAAPNDTIVIVNLAPAASVPDDVLGRVDYLVANAPEAEALTGVRPTDDETCLAAARVFLDRGARNVILTLGDQGAFLATPQAARHFSTLQVRPVDGSAAEDAFTGALARFLAENRPVESSIYLANAAAAMTTLRPGGMTALPTLREMREHVGELF